MTSFYEGREVWFVTGSQDLYGEETLAQVAEQSREVVRLLNESDLLPAPIVWKPVLKDSDSIKRAMLEASADDRVLGVISWMHTFSPAKMWIREPRGPAQAPAAPGDPGQCRDPLGQHRHGLHEPEPGGAR